MSTVLSRKLKGVADAIEYSADAVSQAANSAVELIDRMLRETFSEDYVSQWVSANFEDDRGLLRVNKVGKQVRRNAPRSCASSTAVRASPRSSPSSQRQTRPYSTTLSRRQAIVSVRRDLEHMKHTDNGTPEERERMLVYIRGLQGALFLALKLSWLAREMAGTNGGELASDGIAS